MTRAIVALLLLSTTAAADVRLPRVLSDGVVLQRERRVQVFGFADPMERVRVSASWGATADEALTDQDGTWRTTILTPAAGGPYTLEVRGKNVVTVSDVMVGEVWLCSGQSNMEMPVAPKGTGYLGVQDWENEVARADFPAIRVFTVENEVAGAPKDDVRGEWSAVTPATAGGLSATAYFFGRKLHQELGIPIGLIDASWGGTPAESWTSGITLARLPDFAEQAQRTERDAREPAAAVGRRVRAIEGWLAGIEEIDHGLRDGFARADFADFAWQSVAVPGALTGDLAKHDGVVWMRLAIEVPGALAGQELRLMLGPVDDFDVTWFDGVPIGTGTSSGSARTPRSYRVPAGLVTEGKHVIAVRVLDVGGEAGIVGATAPRLTSKSSSIDVPLASAWRARAGAKLPVLPPRPAGLDVGPSTPSALYNAMIAPLVRFGIRGVIWYQGESNRTRAYQYKTLFPALIGDWRARFADAQMPFYYVQIAPFAYPNDQGEAAELREAQRLASAVPNTGMVVTTDIGDEKDIHPRDKQEVGRRLALWALAKTYGKDVLQDLDGLPASPIRADTLPWITARGVRAEGWQRREDELYLSAPITKAEDGVPIGNGTMGVLVWGGNETVSLTIAGSEPWGAAVRGMPGQDPDLSSLLFEPTQVPGVRVDLAFLDTQVRRFALDLLRGEARAELAGGTLRVFASSRRPIVVVRVQGAALGADWDPDRLFDVAEVGYSSFHVSARVQVPGEMAAIALSGSSKETFAIAAARRDSAGGTDVVIARVEGAESSDPLAVACERARVALSAGNAQLMNEQLAGYRALSATSRVVIGDDRLQTVYDLARHLLVSGSRRGSPPLTRTGSWAPRLPSTGWRTDFEAPSTYGAADVAGLHESLDAYFDFHWHLLPRFTEIARDALGIRGAVVPREFSVDGTPMHDGGVSGVLSGGGLTAFLFARHWRITRDEEFLRDRAWPFCKAVGEAMLELAPLGADGKRRMRGDGTEGMAATRASFAALEEMARAQKLDDAASDWARALAELPDFGQGAAGSVLSTPGGRTDDKLEMLAIQPFGMVSIEGSRSEREAVDAAVDLLVEREPGPFPGSQLPWVACVAARAGRPETALRFLHDLVRTRTLRNGFATDHDPAVPLLTPDPELTHALAGNMLAMEAVHEMLLQSWGGVVRVFPATSVTWPDATFDQLRAEGGFVVSARRAGGDTVEVRVRATVPARLRLRDPFGAAGAAWNRAEVRRDGADWTVDLAAGEELVGTRATAR